MLQPDLPGASVLDGFAGSGALGIEALSRGAAAATFVERSRAAVAAIRDNLEVTGLGDRATVVPRDLVAVLRATPPGAPFDLVLLDPPYSLTRTVLDDVVDLVRRHVAPGAVVVVERGRRGAPPRWPAGVRPAPQRRYGDTVVHVARVTDQEDHA